MFKARLDIMAEVVNELHKEAAKLNSYMEELVQAAAALSGFSHMDGPIKRINREKERLSEKATMLSLMGKTLETIQEQYLQADRRAEDYCENGIWARPRETSSYYDLKWLADFMNKFEG